MNELLRRQRRRLLIAAGIAADNACEALAECLANLDVRTEAYQQMVAVRLMLEPATDQVHQDLDDFDKEHTE